MTFGSLPLGQEWQCHKSKSRKRSKLVKFLIFTFHRAGLCALLYLSLHANHIMNNGHDPTVTLLGLHCLYG